MEPLEVLGYRSFEDHRGSLDIVKPPDEDVGFTQLLCSHNPREGTVRGLHCSPYAKYIRVITGKLEDFCMVLKEGVGGGGGGGGGDGFMVPRREVLTPESGWRRIPADAAHGFRTLEANTTMYYLTTGAFDPAREREFSPYNRQTGWTREMCPIVSLKDAGGAAIPGVDVQMIGGSGFIGSHMMEAIRRERPGWSIACCPQRLEEAAAIREHISIVQPRFVVLAAGLSSPRGVAILDEQATELSYVNYEAPVALIRWLRASRLPTKLVIVGSGMIFTEGDATARGDDDVGDRQDLAYCAQRNLLERVVRDYRAGGERDVLLLRYHLPYSRDVAQASRTTNFAVKLQKYSRINNVRTSATPLDDMHPLIPRLLEAFEAGAVAGTLNFVARGTMVLKEIAGGEGVADGDGDGDEKQGIVLDASRVWEVCT